MPKPRCRCFGSAFGRSPGGGKGCNGIWLLGAVAETCTIWGRCSCCGLRTQGSSAGERCGESPWFSGRFPDSEAAWSSSGMSSGSSCTGEARSSSLKALTDEARPPAEDNASSSGELASGGHDPNRLGFPTSTVLAFDVCRESRMLRCCSDSVAMPAPTVVDPKLKSPGFSLDPPRFPSARSE